MLTKGNYRKRLSVSFEERDAALLERQAQKRRLTVADMIREAVKEWGNTRYRTVK